MRRTDREITDIVEIESILNECDGLQDWTG